MELRLLNKKFESIAVIENYQSFIWTIRYAEAGDFQIDVSMSADYLKLLEHDFYLRYSEDPERLMIIEDFETETSIDSGNSISATGRSLESILERRIIAKQTILSGSLQNGIKKILEENAINPSDPARKISNLIFEESTDQRILDLQLEAQLMGDTLYDAICSICAEKKLGFKITINENNQFVFKLYFGSDRSYNQMANSYITFSNNFENLLSSNYLNSKKLYKTVALVAGEGEGASRKTFSVNASESGPGTELDRRELFVDAKDISSNVDGRTLSEKEYNDQLAQRGKEKLKENKVVTAFDGEIDTTKMYKFEEDFFLGDLVQLENEYGIKGTVRITEYIRSEDSNGYSEYPTFIANED